MSRGAKRILIREHRKSYKTT
nr:hypothetical protein [Rickettsia tillamookensis]